MLDGVDTGRGLFQRPVNSRTDFDSKTDQD